MESFFFHKEGGTCSNNTDTNHADCLNNAATWTPNVVKYNGAGEVYPTSAAWNTYNYPWGGVQDAYDILVFNASDMFDGCVKKKINKHRKLYDCNSKQ